MNLWTTLRGLYAGEGVGRLMMNQSIAQTVDVAGVTVDIGGRGQPSYRSVLKNPTSVPILVVDLFPDPTVNVVASITHLPLAAGTCDTVFCFNVLEHVFEYEAALAELRRVLKPDGRLYGRVPFLLNVHADPNDYWRYTAVTLRQLLTSAGFAEVAIDAEGGMGVVMLNLMRPVLRFGLLRLIAAAVARLFDLLIGTAIGRQQNRDRYPTGYFFVAQGRNYP